MKLLPNITELPNQSGSATAIQMPNDFRQMIRQKSAQKGIVRADELELLEVETTNGQRHQNDRNFTISCRASRAEKWLR